MLSNLWCRIVRQKRAPSRVSPGTRLYAVGDIHGHADPLRGIRRLIHEDACRAQAPHNIVVYLGDYIDRSTDSRAVIDLMLDDPLPDFDCIHLKGNHDNCLARVLVDPEIGELWLSRGGDDTLCSYGVVPPRSLSDLREIQRAQQDLRQVLPPRHEAFFHELKPAHVEGDYCFVHAGIRPGVPLEDQAEADM